MLAWLGERGGANTDLANNEHDKLHFAVWKGFAAAVEVLLRNRNRNRKVELEEAERHQLQALALEQGHIAVVRLLAAQRLRGKGRGGECLNHAAVGLKLDQNLPGADEWMACDPGAAALLGADKLSRYLGGCLYYPYMTSGFLHNLQTWEKLGDKDVYEMGGGMSTVWWASRARSVTTVDDQGEFLCRIQGSLALLGLEEKVELRASQGDHVAALARIGGEEGGRQFDIIVIDGEPGSARCATLFEALKHLKPGGVIVADNWSQPRVWDGKHAWCVQEVEATYDVHGFCHEGWPEEEGQEKRKKLPHRNGWKTIWFRPGDERRRKSSAERPAVPNCM